VPTPTASFRSTQPADCDDVLSYVDDLTIPDGTEVAPGSIIDKRWKVENSGTCSWDAGYRITHIKGPDLGASIEQPLYPALSHTTAVIRILYTAPNEPGIYRSEWKTVNPDGIPFGDAIYIVIEVVAETPDSTEEDTQEDTTGNN